MICLSCRTENIGAGACCPICGAVLPTYGPGSVIASRYVIVAPLGQGGMGTVYQARDQVLEEDVAIKILRAERTTSTEAARRLRSEIKLARKVSHPNVCRIHEYGEEQAGLGYISMELVAGVNLRQLLRERGAPPPPVALTISEQLLEGMQAIHDAGIIHRDLKPSNVMIDLRGAVRLMDFGIAKPWGRADAESITTGGDLVGTPEYMSPEQGRGQPLDLRSDIYSLGVVLFELFTARVMFTAPSPVEVILRHIHEPPPLDSPTATAIPEPVLAVLARSLAKSPDDRYATLREMKEAFHRAEAAVASGITQSDAQTALGEMVHSLRSATAPGATSTFPESPRERDVRVSPRERPWLAGLTIASAALVAAAMAVAFGRVRREEPPILPPVSTPQGRIMTADPTPPVPSDRAPVVTPRVPTPRPPREAASGPTPLAPAPSTTLAPALPAAETQPPPVPSEQNIQLWILALRDPNLRASAIEELVRAGAAAEPRLIEELGSAEAAIQIGARQVLGRMGVDLGILRLRVRPWAEVIVDGKALGPTPLRPRLVKAGTHTLRLEHPGYVPLERQVTVLPGVETELDIDLRRDAEPARRR